MSSGSVGGLAARQKVIDLFCGCGGFSLGAARAGFSVVAAVDNDVRALNTHKKNFPATKQLDADLLKIDGISLLRKLRLAPGDLHGIIGGPPCQGFSSIGRGNVFDPRNKLLAKFFSLVAQIQPRFFVCENVPGLYRDQYVALRKKAISTVEGTYKILEPIAIRADLYGAPTNRTRFFLIGLRLDCDWSVRESDFAPPSDLHEVTVKEALKGLPCKITATKKRTCALRKLTSTVNGVFGSKLRSEIPEGVGAPEAIRRLTDESVVSACQGTTHSSAVKARFAAVLPGGTDEISRFPRLDPNGFCPTIRAGTGSDKGSHQAARPIHPTADRVITPREAARLQGFPDWFVFDDTKWHTFKSIGNSVSPIVAEFILRVIHTDWERLING